MGTAKAQTEANMAGRYLPLFGQVLVFKAGETEKEIIVTILDDNEWQPDEHFFVTLTPATPDIEIPLSTHQVIILNDDDPGKFSFSEISKACLESDQKVKLKIDRSDGVAGQALVYVKLIPLADISEEHSIGADIL